MKMTLSFFSSAAVLAALTLSAKALLRDDTVVIERPIDSAASSSVVIHSSKPTETPTPLEEPKKPGSVRLKMPFASQAPSGNWDPPYDEACEEASLIIVAHYLENVPLDGNIMTEDLLAMVQFEESKGLPVDIDMNQLAVVAKQMFGYNAEVVEGDGVTIERIESEIAKGNPVIVPLAGQDIGNPYYSGEGPPYHVLVIVGYDATHFTTHDVGTKRGENYIYQKQTIMSAIHDWNGSVETIRNGPKRVLVVTK